MQLKVIVIDRNDAADNETILDIDSQVVVTVKGFGTADYRWTIAWGLRGAEVPDPKKTITGVLGEPDDEGWWHSDSLGQGAVYFEEMTFAHCIRDMIWNS